VPWYTEKIGPVPAYVIVIGGGVGLGALVWRSRARSDSTPAPLDVSTMEDAPFLGGLQPGQGGGVPLWNGAAPGPGNPTIETNNDWNRHALTILIGMSYDPTMAAGALTKFLQGKPLNDAENAVVQRALQLA